MIIKPTYLTYRRLLETMYHLLFHMYCWKRIVLIFSRDLKSHLSFECQIALTLCLHAYIYFKEVHTLVCIFSCINQIIMNFVHPPSFLQVPRRTTYFKSYFATYWHNSLENTNVCSNSGTSFLLLKKTFELISICDWK